MFAEAAVPVAPALPTMPVVPASPFMPALLAEAAMPAKPAVTALSHGFVMRCSCCCREGFGELCIVFVTCCEWMLLSSAIWIGLLLPTATVLMGVSLLVCTLSGRLVSSLCAVFASAGVFQNQVTNNLYM